MYNICIYNARKTNKKTSKHNSKIFFRITSTKSLIINEKNETTQIKI